MPKRNRPPYKLEVARLTAELDSLRKVVVEAQSRLIRDLDAQLIEAFEKEINDPDHVGPHQREVSRH